MKDLKIFFLSLVWALVAVAPSGWVLAQSDRTHVLLVHPVFTPAQAELVHQPLIDYLNAVTDYRFELQTARDFHRYWLDARRGQQPDLVLEDAHMIAFRMQRHAFVPLVRSAEPASFSLLAADFDLVGLNEFVGRPVSSMPAPSLGHLVLASWFNNPMQQPILDSSAVSWLDAVEMVFAGDSEAAIVPHSLVRKYVTMAEVASSPEFPHMNVAASPDLPASVRDAVRQALLDLHEQPDFFEVLDELEVQQFVAANPEEYAGLERWLNYVFSRF
ncbi:MAG: phosphate/phosphite/phosphonate ABC transporter substrate-binding protein [Wenzhouxiangella sp.]